MSNEEIWLPIVQNPEFGQVSNLGRVKNTKGKMRTVFIGAKGYERVGFKGGKYTFTVHSLVAKAFVQKPEWAQEVNHIDGNKLNNRSNNLEWVTKKQNTHHAYDHGLRANSHRKAKIPKDHKEQIVQRVANGESQRSIAKEYGVNPSSLCVYLNGRKSPPDHFSWRV